VVRTLGSLGHEYTQGTVDSNETWLDVTVRAGDRVIARSGAMDDGNTVDPWSKFFNVYMLDRDGQRIDRRNPQDIFVPLYNQQIPPGAADLTRYAFTVPADVDGPITVDAAVRYRKFDTTYMRYVYGAEYVNVLPVMTLATDQVVFGGAVIPPAENAAIGAVVTPVAPGAPAKPATPAATPTWERWLDAGIAHFRVADRAAGKGQWAQADQAFAEAAAAGRVEGWIGRARVALRDGRIDEAASYLRTAAEKHPGQLPWSVAYWSAVIDMQNGQYDRAMDGFRAVSATAFTEAHARGFDFSRDDRVLTDWASACLERARQLREPGDAEKRTALYAEAVALTDRALLLDSQRFQSWYIRMQALEAMGDASRAADACAAYERYRPDDNARDRAVNAARARDAAANHAAEPAAVYDLQRVGAPGLVSGAVARSAP
jgi:tetratricopeptide (TPR) repeat protein